MELQVRKLSDINPYKNNPRKNEGAIDAVCESIRQCGYIAPIIVDEQGEILAGHTRYKALKKLGKTECEVILKAGLTEEQKKKYRLLDNKTNEIAGWDFELLDIELAELDFDGYDFGFDSICVLWDDANFSNACDGPNASGSESAIRNRYSPGDEQNLYHD